MLPIREKILIHQIKNGDEQAFTFFYESYKDKIYRFIYFKTSDQEKAHDLMGDSFIKVYDYIKKGNEIDNFQALLYRIARNLVIDFYRTRREEISLEDAPETISPNNIEDEVGDRLKVAQIKKYLNNIKKEYREVVLLHYFDNFSFSEVAEIVGETEGNIRVRAYRGIKQLKKILKEEKSV